MTDPYITRHALPDGAWVDIRDAARVPERLRRPVKAIQMRLAANPAFSGVVAAAAKGGVQSLGDISEEQATKMAATMGGDAMALMDDLNDLLILSRVAGWSFEAEVTAEALLDLPGAVYDRLRELCADGGLNAGPDFSPSQDPASPTGPSTD